MRILFVLACLAATLAPLVPGPPPPPEAAPFPGWPASFEGRPLRKLPLTATERAFAGGFPGRIARFTDGRREVIVRWVTRPTRQLHPAADCFRGLGYETTPQPLHADAAGVQWGQFEAVRGPDRLLIRERLYVPNGPSWPDISSWYWAALLGDAPGPWWAVTVAERS